MSTIVGTNIEVTNIKYDSDTTSMIISSTGQITAQGEGTNTTNLQQGLSKAWTNFTGITTTTIRDSFNIASFTDAGGGVTNPISVTTNMANGNFTGSYFQNGAAGVAYNSFNNGYVGGFGSRSTSAFGVYSHSASGGTDADQNDVVIHGDLA